MALSRVLGRLPFACLACLLGCDSAPKDEPARAKVVAEVPASERVSPPADSPAPSVASKCDGVGFDTLAASFATAAAPERAQLAVRGLIERCDAQLPPRVRWTLRTLLPEHERELLETVKADDDEIAVWEAACPGHATVLAEAMEAPSSERAGLIYDRCDFARFELMTKSDLATRSFSGLPPWVVHHWLIEHGASKASAQAISLAMFDLVDVVNAGSGP